MQNAGASPASPGTLQITMPTEREIVLTRVFAAPRSLVFDAYSKPELLKRWLGVWGGWSMVVCEVDLWVGGAYRFAWRGPGGADMGVRGVYREIVPPERLVHTEAFDDGYEGEALVTTVLVEEGGTTRLTSTILYPSREIRDEVLKSGMERGVAQSYDTLAELLASIA
ncbi:MAG: SRPBCC family protein [Chloroflexota bacterium]